MASYQQIYSFLPYFKELANNRENSVKGTKLFYTRQEMMYTEYSKEMEHFTESVYSSNFIDRRYSQTLKEYGIEDDLELKTRLIAADKKLLKAILTHMLRSERYVSGAWISFEEEGLFLKALQRLGILYGYSLK